jgi:hypothetical protein
LLNLHLQTIAYQYAGAIRAHIDIEPNTFLVAYECPLDQAAMKLPSATPTRSEFMIIPEDPNAREQDYVRMIATELLSNLRARSMRLTVEDERLCYDAPAGELSQSDLAELRAHESGLLPYPNRETASTIPDPAGPCSTCGGGH